MFGKSQTTQIKNIQVKIYFVNIEGYIYLVPHILSEEHIFLKTIIPSRKATKDYQREQGGQ